MKSGTLYLIPCPIVEHKNDSIPEETKETAYGITHFIVERERTARRWLRSIDHPTAIDDMTLLEMDKNDNHQDLTSLLSKLKSGVDIGVISEAGCPCIADPGHRAVSYAHKHGYAVSPLVGPNSILMALMASGFSGQSFTFHGYLPSKKPELAKKLKSIESDLQRTGYTQLFMEAPYRNGFMIESVAQTLSGNLKLCVACDINDKTQEIKTLSLQVWKKQDLKKYHKRPAIFVLGR